MTSTEPAAAASTPSPSPSPSPTPSPGSGAGAWAGRVPPHAYFVVSAVFHYLGPAFAVLLFARVDVLGVAWLRIASAALVFAVWRRPWRTWRRLDGPTRRLLLGWGAVLAVMNSCFYLAIDRLPLGTVAAIEFLPVIALAALAARTRRNITALMLAVAGVYLVTDVRLVAEPVGIAFAAANALLFAGYIVLGHRVARSAQLPGIDGLALSMLIAAAVALPIGITGAGPALTDLTVLAADIGVGVSSSVIPYLRPARDEPPAPRDLRPDGVAAARHRHRHRRAGPHPDPHCSRGRRRRPGRCRRRAAPRPHRRVTNRPRRRARPTGQP